MTGSIASNVLCPLTGQPSTRRVHGVKTTVLMDLWKRSQGVDASHLFEGVQRLELYESPAGLFFFHPAIGGDDAFYSTLYRAGSIDRTLSEKEELRLDFRKAAERIGEGDAVLDVGCGPAVFRHLIPEARYNGLDPFSTSDLPFIIRETLGEHSAKVFDHYDVVSAFHFLEHVPDPIHCARKMVDLLKPGGLLIVAVPLHPSSMTDIPNFPINFPPHHLSWWSTKALSHLAAELGLEVVELCTLRPTSHFAMIHWMHRFSMRKTTKGPGERYLAHRWDWHISLAAAYWAARLFVRLKDLPADATPIEGFLVARKPAAR